MVCLYFGLPGAGKTTVATSLALQFSEPSLSNPYRHVYHNVKSMKVPGATYIDNECIGKFDISDSAIIIDEAQLFADNRDYKTFNKDLKEFFFGHRHYNCDIFLFSQQWDSLDKKIRSITDRVYYVYKPKILGMFMTNYYRIPYDIIIPDPKKSQQSLGEIIQGYCKPSLFQRLIATKRLFRPKFYPYFNSFEKWRIYDPLPDKYSPEPLTELQKNKRKKIRKYKRFKLKIKTFIQSKIFLFQNKSFNRAP